ncbi:MAG: DUF2007 domain-containing protein [Syntrophorhabdales bacterium]|jgi:hypothetical protein
MTSNRWTRIHTVESIFEMDVLKAALEKESIEYVMKEHKDTAYDGLFILQKGYATLFVRETDEAPARAVVKGVKQMLFVAS